ncbi:hypothetical protein [Bartonella sp. HY406]|uniref:hypothetical protein n=1 Tax=Bartonella sp. HY406 TaxID=2979331 RepID=UPI0021CA6842|nr:hypothetical protein [Bartonella sp. HY406]UXN03835.1 hypothetical protein N6B01_01985 [Bartonella sp. HY406]
MIIYEKIFFQIIEPFLCLWDNDEMGDQVMEFENKKDYDGLKEFIQNNIENHLIYLIGDDYLKSNNVKNTIFYYVNCCSTEKLDAKLASYLISFTEISVFTTALDNILKKMINLTGNVTIKCEDIIENSKSLDEIEIFNYSDAWVDYLIK